MDKYLQFNHLELSEDPSFIRWAKGSLDDDDLDWEGWLVNHPEMSETVEKAKALVLAMKFVEDKPDAAIENKIWDNISSNINTQQDEANTPKKRGLVVRLMPYAAIAAVALLLFIFQWGNDFDTTVQVPLAKVENITLPDGSEVLVNAGSTIKYDGETWSKDRLVSLEGEAFFEVKKGSKFTVETPKGTVEVLGTSFNVYGRKDQFNVQCETGRVAVRSSGRETILTPQQAVAVVDGEHLFEEKINENAKRSTWRSGIFVYNGDPLSEVVAELERQFDIRIKIDDSQKSTQYNGSFKRTDLNDALTEVFYPLNLQFEIKGKNVIISE